MEPTGATFLDPDMSGEPAAVLEHGRLLVADAQTEIERGVGASAHPSSTPREPEPRGGRERSGRRLPDRDLLADRSGSEHGAQSALRAWAVQALCVWITVAGCAHAPPVSSGAEARGRFLESFARGDSPTRGAGMLSIERGKSGRKGLNTSWAAVAESLVMAAYVGPIRTLDGSILGDSLYLAMRPYDLGLAGVIPPEEGLGARGLLFLARPWAFGAPWIREALEHASVTPGPDGWRLAGTLENVGASQPFVLELSRKSDPQRLRVGRAEDPETLIEIRYGPPRRYPDGRIPRWIEWTRGDTRLRLEIEDHARARPSQLRHPPPAKEEWTILALDDPKGRDLLRRLLGIGEGSQP